MKRSSKSLFEDIQLWMWPSDLVFQKVPCTGGLGNFKKADEPVSNDLKVLKAEMAKLKAEFRRTTEERDILKKAAAYFAKQSE